MFRLDPKKAIWPVGIGTALSIFGDATLYTVLPTHTREVGITLASVGLLLGINRAIRIFLNGPAGLLYDRLPRRVLFITGLLLGALSTAMYALSHSLWLLLLGRLFWGLSWSLIWIGGTTIVLDVASENDRGHLMGLYQTWFFLGQTLGALAGGFLTDLFGYTYTMWTGTLLGFLGTVTAILFLPETGKLRREVTLIRQETKLFRPKNGIWTAASIYGVNRLITAGVLAATLALVVEQQAGAYPMTIGVASLTGILMAMRTVIAMLASISTGKASDLTGSRWKLTNWILLAGAVGMLALVWNNPVALFITIILGSVAAGGLQTISSTLSGELVDPDRQGAAIGLIHTSGDFGSAIGPPLAYALLPIIGLPGVYILCAGIFILQMIPVTRYQFAERKSLLA
jgi:MFS family permease